MTPAILAAERARRMQAYREAFAKFLEDPVACQYHEVTALLDIFRSLIFALEALSLAEDDNTHAWAKEMLRQLEVLHERMLTS